MHQDNVIELIELIKSDNLSKLDKNHILEQLCQKREYKLNHLISELHNSNINLETYLPVIIQKTDSHQMYTLVESLNSLNINYSKYLTNIINKCSPLTIDDLVGSLNNNPTINYSKHLKFIIKKCSPHTLGKLVKLLNNNSNINYSKYLKAIIKKFSPHILDELVDSLNNNPNINYSKHLKFIIKKCSHHKINKLVYSLNDNPNINYPKYLKYIINNCSPFIMHELVDSLNNNPNINYSKYLKSIIKKCSPLIMHELVNSLNNNVNIDYSKYLKYIINNSNPYTIDNLVDSLNGSIVNFKKQLTPTLFKKITNVKSLQRITTNVSFGIDTPKLTSQISLLIENIKDSCLSHIDKKKIIYINKLIKKIYTTKNKSELYNIFNILSKDQTSYVDLINNATEKVVSNFYTKNLDLDIHKRKNYLNPKIDKDIRCGIEIETAGLGQNKILDLQLDKFSYDEDISISNYNKRTNVLYIINNNTAELVSHIIDPYNKDDISNIYSVCETLKQNGATTNFKCGLHVHVSGDGISKDNPQILNNLISDMVFMQNILIEKLNIYSSRINKHTKLIPSEFLGKSFDFIEYCKKDDYLNKYYMLNFLSLEKYGTLEFRLFNLPDSIDANMVLAYADMATSMVNSVRKKGSFYNKIQSIYNIKNMDLSDTKLTDSIYNKFLDYIDVSKDTKKILTNTDKIFNLYKAKEPKNPELTEQIIDFHTPKNKIVPTPVNRINIYEDTKDILYSVDGRTLSTSKNSKFVYFYPYTNFDNTNKKQLVKSTKKHVFYPKPTEKDPYCHVV